MLQVTSMDGWGLTNLRRSSVSRVGNRLDVSQIENQLIDENEAVYWIAPEQYLGNHVCIVSLLICFRIDLLFFCVFIRFNC